MKTLASIIVIIISFSVTAQSVYQFDHILEYNYKPESGSDTEKEYWMTNSADNRYILLAKEIEDSVAINFYDTKGLHSYFRAKTSEFLEESLINLPCSIVHPSKLKSRPYRRYYYSEVKNPVSGKKQYVIRHEKEKREKRKNLNRYYTTIRPNTEYHETAFENPMEYFVWKKGGNVPMGISETKYAVSAKGDTTQIHELKKIYRINKVVRIPDECN